MKNFLKHSLWWQIGLTCVGSVFNLFDFADYSTYLYLVPISVLLLVAALLSGLVTYCKFQNYLSHFFQNYLSHLTAPKFRKNADPFAVASAPLFVVLQSGRK